MSLVMDTARSFMFPSIKRRSQDHLNHLSCQVNVCEEFMVRKLELCCIVDHYKLTTHNDHCF